MPSDRELLTAEMTEFDRLPAEWQAFLRASDVKVLATEARDYIRMFGPKLGMVMLKSECESFKRKHPPVVWVSDTPLRL